MSRLFIGLYPAGIVYADRAREEHGDYKRCAFLGYRSLELEVQSDCPAALRSEIKEHADKVIAKRGESLVVSGCGQTVLLGG